MPKKYRQPSGASDAHRRRGEYTPVYVVTGFLDAGKTTLLNAMIHRRLAEGLTLCCIQFEQGEAQLAVVPQQREALEVLRFSIRSMQKEAKSVARRLFAYLLRSHPDEIWIEWNGMLPFSDLQGLFPPVSRDGSGTLGDFCEIKKVFYLADAQSLQDLIGRTGGVQAEQIACCDVALLRHFASREHFRVCKRTLRALNPGVKVLPRKPLRNAEWLLEEPKRRPALWFALGVFGLIGLYLLLHFGLLAHTQAFSTIVNIFLGIQLQALPFLLIGVLLSSAIQLFVSQQFIERRFPKSITGGMLFALLAGFCLPVCDCASIPIFRSLVNKGVPVAAAVTFMAATPIINPVAVLSTWYAFNGNIRIVLCRIGLGILCSLLVGLTFCRMDKKSLGMTAGFAGTLCACGCYSGTLPAGWKGKALLYFRHAQTEFFSVGKYLLLGGFISALFQTLGGNLALSQGRNGLLLPLLLMMVMAFFLSLCSSSDAIVARSLSNQFPMGALMGFLVFGPMMDVKNVVMLSGGFPKKFILRLALTMFFVCALVVFAAFHLGLERVLL